MIPLWYMRFWTGFPIVRKGKDWGNPYHGLFWEQSMIAVLFSDSSTVSPPTRYLWKTLLVTLSCHIEFVKKFELQNSDSKNSPVTYAPKVYVRKSFIVDTIKPIGRKDHDHGLGPFKEKV